MRLDKRAEQRTKERIECELWIDRQGKVYQYKGTLWNAWEHVISMHYEIAKKLYPKMEYPEDYLMKLGWLRAGSSCGHSIDKCPTQAQLNACDKLGLHGLVKSLIKEYNIAE